LLGLNFGEQVKALPRLTRTEWAGSLITDEVLQTNSDGSPCGRACGLRIRLRGHDDSRTGDAVLRFHALRAARSRRSGLLQIDALDARAVCAISSGAQPFAGAHRGCDFNRL